MGVEPLEPGFARVRIRPQVYAGLKEAKLKMPTVRGTIEVGWKEAEIDMTVPANMVAEVYVPGGATTESGVPIEKAPGVKVLSALNQDSVYEIGGGTYRFAFPATW
jgi:alpha-L-rhamnosidase